MLKLVKYLKTSILPILLIVLLLVVQAMCDLSLPDYTAKIVDIGIQKGRDRGRGADLYPPERNGKALFVHRRGGPATGGGVVYPAGQGQPFRYRLRQAAAPDSRDRNPAHL